MKRLFALRHLWWLLLVACTPGVYPDAVTTLAPGEPPLPAVPSPLPQIVVAPELPATPTIAAAPTATVVPDTGWLPLRPGMERRIINLVNGEAEGRQQESVYILRLDPDYYRFDVAYRPGQPQFMQQWQAETGALVVVNAGYFTENYVHTGRIVAGGVASGSSYGDFAGMFVVTEAGPQLRWLRQRPYDPAETLVAAVQSFPLLVRPGGVVGFPEEDGKASRRTAVAEDRQGRILFLVAPQGAFTLHQFSLFLVHSDLELEIALNLDGGSSSGLLLADPVEGVPAFLPLPAVITVYEQ
jgi:uncharacterized protein YigE (DUF2233 family)